jgi:hypothetical protein
MTVATVPKIYSALASIMKEIGAVEKMGKNTQQGYAFRRVDDVYAAAQPLFAKFGVIPTANILEERSEERTTKSGANMIYRILKIRWVFTAAEDGSSVTSDAIGEGMDSGDKASNKAMSVSQKYAICEVLLIPTDEPKDPENDDHEVAPKSAKANPPARVEKPGDVIVPYGKSAGKKISELSPSDQLNDLNYWNGREKKEGKPLGGKVAAYRDALAAYLEVPPPFENARQPQFNDIPDFDDIGF